MGRAAFFCLRALGYITGEVIGEDSMYSGLMTVCASKIALSSVARLANTAARMCAGPRSIRACVNRETCT